MSKFLGIKQKQQKLSKFIEIKAKHSSSIFMGLLEGGDLEI